MSNTFCRFIPPPSFTAHFLRKRLLLQCRTPSRPVTNAVRLRNNSLPRIHRFTHELSASCSI